MTHSPQVLTQSLTQELNELKVKAAKLSAFILDAPEYKELTAEHRYALNQQYKAQCLYTRALELRLELLGRESAAFD